MLDKKTEMMLQVANTLTAEDLDGLRELAVAVQDAEPSTTATEAPAGGAENAAASVDAESLAGAEAMSGLNGSRPRATRRQAHRAAVNGGASSATRGEYEQQRTRESKVSTGCLGEERQRHNWWPVGTEIVGRIGAEIFTARVVENSQVKSGRSVLITSGAANGRLCITPTRAAIEATEAYRQAHNLGRGGGITNGWEFWTPRA